MNEIEIENEKRADNAQGRVDYFENKFVHEIFGLSLARIIRAYAPKKGDSITHEELVELYEKYYGGEGE